MTLERFALMSMVSLGVGVDGSRIAEWSNLEGFFDVRDGHEMTSANGKGRWLKADMHVHGPVEGLDPPPFTARYIDLTGHPGWPAGIIPFSRSVGAGVQHIQVVPEDVRMPGDKPWKFGGRAITQDDVFDQCVATWETIFKDLKDQGIEFVVFSAHDLPSSRLNQKFKGLCAEHGIMCTTGSEMRQERSRNCADRCDYVLRNAGNGPHHLVLDGEFEGRMAVMQHPNANVQDRLDPVYFEHRIQGAVTGTEAGTPFAHRDAIEVYNGWLGEYLSHGQHDEDNKGFADPPVEFGSFTAKDGGAFALNKWDAVLSRGHKIWGQAGSCAYSKSWQTVQEHRLNQVLSRIHEKSVAKDEMDRLAEFVRATPLGGGYVKIFVPDGATLTVNFLLNQMAAGHYVAHADSSPLAPIEVVATKVSPDRSAYSVELGDGSEDVTCSAVMNHGRMVALQPHSSPAGRPLFTAAASAVCSDPTSPHECGYIRIQCRRPVAANPKYQADYNYVFFQPQFSTQFPMLANEYSEEPYPFVEALRLNKTLMMQVRRGFRPTWHDTTAGSRWEGGVDTCSLTNVSKQRTVRRVFRAWKKETVQPRVEAEDGESER